MRDETSATFVLPLERVLVNAHFNLRIFYGDIEQLAVQLMTEGQLEPIKVRRDGEQYFVVDGHRRQRALARARELQVSGDGEHYWLVEGERRLREAPGPMHRNFHPDRILCRMVDPLANEDELFASQLVYNSGKPFTLLERMIFISRLCRQGSGCTKEQLALKTGFSRTYIANAQSLNAADPRLLDYVREGRISQKLALRLLKTFSSEEQIARVCAAMADAGRHHRDKLLPKDFDWGPAGETKSEAELSGPHERMDPVRARLHDLVSRLEDAERFAPNPTAQDRLGTLMQINRYATGKLSYARLESHLLGRE